MKKAVFLDRDGTLNKDTGYPASFQSIEIFHYSYEAVKKLNQAGLLAIVVTNQSGVGRGLIPENALDDIHRRMKETFASRGASFDGIYYCPFFASSSDPRFRRGAECRKPQPGMGLKAARELNVDLERSYMIGDKVEDILFGINLGAKPILLLTGSGRNSLKELRERSIHPVFVAEDLLIAVNWILDRESGRASAPTREKKAR